MKWFNEISCISEILMLWERRSSSIDIQCFNVGNEIWLALKDKVNEMGDE